MSLYELNKLSMLELLRLNAETLTALRKNHGDIYRSSNKPTGDFAEHLFCEAFGWDRENNSKEGYDATDPKTGLHYQIKSRQIAGQHPVAKERQLSEIRKLKEKKFNFLAVVFFHKNYSIHRAAIIPVDALPSICTNFYKHTNSNRLILRDTIWDMSTVQDVTEKLQKSLLIMENSDTHKCA